jgi:hypothetical protein
MLRTSTCSTGGSEIATMLHLIRKIIDSPIHLDSTMRQPFCRQSKLFYSVSYA